jgi:uncharacterized membrane protein
MRPASITMFDRLFLVSLALGALNTVLSYDTINAELESDPALAALGSASTGIMIFSLLFGMGISLLLWFFISRKASTVAKWILTVLTVIGTLMLPFSLGTGPLFMTIVAVIITVMQLVAVGMLFRGDAKAWFDNRGQSVDPATFE